MTTKAPSFRCQRAKSAKPVTWVYEPEYPGCGVLEVTRGETLSHYIVHESTPDPESAPGRHFRLRKIGGPELYDCHIADLPELSTCDCADCTFASRPHQCKHLIAIRAVVDSGEIDREREPVPSDLCDCWDCYVYSHVTGYVCPKRGGKQPTTKAKPSSKCDESTPARLTTPCPTCLAICELVPVSGRKYTHEIRCRECEERS